MRVLALMLIALAGVVHAEGQCPAAGTGSDTTFGANEPSPRCDGGCEMQKTSTCVGLNVGAIQPCQNYQASFTGRSCTLTSGAGGCSTAPSCGSAMDAAQCEIVHQAWKAQCQMNEIYKVQTQAAVTGGHDCSAEPTCTHPNSYTCVQIVQHFRSRCAAAQAFTALQTGTSELSTILADSTTKAADVAAGLEALSDEVGKLGEGVAELQAATLALKDALTAQGAQQIFPEGYLTPLTPQAALDELQKFQPDEGQSTVLPETSVSITQLLTPYEPAQSCPGLSFSFSLGVFGTPNINLGQFCELFKVLGALLHIGSALAAVRIVLGIQ